MEVSVYICYWRDLSLLRLTLPHVQPYAKQVFVHDGRYKEFPECGMHSIDGVRELCDEHENVTYVPPTKVYRTQMEKRNEMFLLTPEGEWLLVVDADEVMFGMKALKDVIPPSGYTVGKTLEYTELAGMMFGLWHERLIKNVSGTSYCQNHYTLMNDNKVITDDWRTELSFMHIRNARSKERNDKQKEYYKFRDEEGVNVFELEKCGNKQEIEREAKRHGYFRVR